MSVKTELFEAPKNKEEAYKKWNIAVKILKILIAAGIVSQDKVLEGYAIVKDLKD